MVKGTVFPLILIILFILNGCGAKEQTAGKPGWVEPDMVTVQHILIGFDGSVPDKDISRSMEEASALARELYERAEAGEDFDMLVEEYTDDSFPGVYQMTKDTGQAEGNPTVFAKSQMAKNFGDVSFSLAVGEIGLAEYDPQDCKYGWHVILRIE
jgi:hypothetical protein